MVGSFLERFKVTKESPYLAICRCIVCGDSQKSKTKTRFTFYEKNGEVNVYCHNCAYSTTLLVFLKSHFEQIYNEYVFEKFKSRDNSPVITTKTPKKSVVQVDDLGLTSVWDLDLLHPARQYVEKRRLPKSFQFKYTDKFNEFSSQFNKEFLNAKGDHPRIVIEYKTKSGKVFCYQGRAIGDHPVKYKTVVLPGNEESPKIFGLDRISFEDRVYLVEGPIDSLFLKNCLACSNASLETMATKLVKSINKLSKENIVLVLDNEPRNPQVLEQYKKAIDAGFNVVIWKSEIEQKDINDMYLAGLNPQKIINENTYSGLLALHHFNSWKKL